MITRKKVKILLIDDNEMLLDILSSMVEEQYAKPDTASTGQEALSKVKSNQYDIIFSDIGLPDINGANLALKIKSLKNGKLVTIIGLTGYDLDDVTQPCLAAGMVKVMAKPLDYPVLHKLIQQYAFKHAKKVVDSKPLKQRKIQKNNYPIIECNVKNNVLDMLIESLPKFLMDTKIALQKKDIGTLIDITHKMYGGLCYTPTPHLRLRVKHFLRTMEKNISDLDSLYNDVVNAASEFKVAYQTMSY